MSILDQVISNGIGGRVVGESHNINDIRVEEDAIARALRGLSGSRGWDASEYGISAEQAAQMLRDADTPAARERVVAELRQRAITRAGLDVSGGRVSVMAAGELPWHGLGVNVDRAVNSADAIAYANLAWEVRKVPLSYIDPAGVPQVAPDVFGIMRQDTGKLLGSVGSRYAPIQNKDAFGFLDAVLADFGAKYETAGALYGGSKVWMLVHMPKQTFDATPGDTIEPYILFTNTHDGSGAASCFPTSVRVVCANTLRTAGHGKHKGLNIRHTGSVRAKIAAAQQALGFAAKSFEWFKNVSQTLVHTPLADIRHYANDVLDAVLDVTAADALKGADVLAAAVATTDAERTLARKSFANKIERRGEILTDILTRYDSDRCQPRGTAWGALNAITEHADHSRPARQSRDVELRQSRRFESAIDGDADTMKQTALELALEYTR